MHNARSILHDYRSLGESVWQCFKGGKEGSLWYYRAVLEALRQTGYSTLLVNELERVVLEVEHLAF